MDMSWNKLWEMVKVREAWVLQSMGSQRVGPNSVPATTNWNCTVEHLEKKDDSCHFCSVAVDEQD